MGRAACHDANRENPASNQYQSRYWDSILALHIDFEIWRRSKTAVNSQILRSKRVQTVEFGSGSVRYPRSAHNQGAVLNLRGGPPPAGGESCYRFWAAGPTCPFPISPCPQPETRSPRRLTSHPAKRPLGGGHHSSAARVVPAPMNPPRKSSMRMERRPWAYNPTSSLHGPHFEGNGRSISCDDAES